MFFDAMATTRSCSFAAGRRPVLALALLACLGVERTADAQPPQMLRLPAVDSQAVHAAWGESTPFDLADESGPILFPEACADCDDIWRWQLMPTGLVYRAYLAGAKESRFQSYWTHEKDNGWIWDVTLGGRAGIVRYGTGGNARPEGFQLDIEGAGLVRLDLEEGNDVDAADFRVGTPITYGTARQQVKFAYYHLSSHVGDEFLLKNPGFTRLNYSRDVLVLGYSVYPTDRVRLYAEAGWAFDDDVSEPWEFQFGLDYAPPGRTGIRGAPFFALNGHLREEVEFGGNVVVQAGWAWRRSPSSGMFRIGAEYYNGKSDQFSFFDESENKIGGGIWYDY